MADNKVNMLADFAPVSTQVWKDKIIADLYDLPLKNHHTNEVAFRFHSAVLEFLLYPFCFFLVHTQIENNIAWIVIFFWSRFHHLFS